MAWFDVLANVGQSLGQAGQTLQEQLLRQRQQEEQRRLLAEEQRRQQLLEARQREQDDRAAASERRQAEQFTFTKQQVMDQDAERLLRAFEGEPIPEDVVAHVAKTAPNVAKALLTRGDTGFTLRKTAAEADAEAARDLARRERSIKGKLMAEQERVLSAQDIRSLPLEDRIMLARTKNLPEDTYFTPREKIDAVKTSQNYLVTQLAAQLSAARQNVVTPEQQRLLNAQVLQMNQQAKANARMEEQEFQRAWKEAMEASYGDPNVRNSGRANWERYLKTLTPQARTQAQLEFLNNVRSSLGYAPTTNPAFRLNPEVTLFDPPYPTRMGKPATTLGGSLGNPLGGVNMPSAAGTTMTLPDGSIVRIQ